MRLIFLSILLSLTVVTGFSQQSLKPGNIAPNFASETLDGNFFSLDQARGKVVVMAFWSTKCQICHTEIPKMNRMVEKHKNNDVVFLALTMENDARILPYLKKNPFNYNILPNSFGTVLKYADMDSRGRINMGFPSYFVINRKGEIAIKTQGWDKTDNIDQQITRLLTE